MGRYLIRVEGRLSNELTATFPTLDSSQCQQTVLHGALSDQKSLTEILDHLRALGVRVLDVRHVAAPELPAHPGAETTAENSSRATPLSLPLR